MRPGSPMGIQIPNKPHMDLKINNVNDDDDDDDDAKEALKNYPYC
jgi:hypothetical protein